MKKSIRKWFGECMRKKKLSASIADAIIKRAKENENVQLFKYQCPHCQGFHLTGKLDK